MATSYQYTRDGIFEGLEAQRANAVLNARSQVVQTPAERAFELVARLDIARQHRDRLAFDAAKAELATLIERM